MLDFGDIPRDRAVTSDVITSAGSWIAWNKPRGIAMIDILAVAAGGGGGAGGGVGVGYFGGSGGGGGSVASLIIPASYLPDVLFISVGTGGAGGSGTGANGSVGGSTVISTEPTNSNNGSILICYGGTGGRGGTANTSALSGSGNTASPKLNSLGYGGISSLSVGPGSATLNTSDNYTPANVYYEDFNSLTCPGAAGSGSYNTRGGSILTRQSFLTPVLSSTETNNASETIPGYILFKPLASLGGAGGATPQQTVPGGTGGRGGLGSGGGGGGNAGGGQPVGSGGRGGDGFVIIKSW